MLVIDYDTPESFQTIPIHITNPFFFLFYNEVSYAYARANALSCGAKG